MKHIIRNTTQVQAILNGATQFRVPVVNPSKYYQSRNQQAVRIEPKNTEWYKDRNYCIREEGGGWMDLTLNDFLAYCKAPFQVNDEVFVKEGFKIGYWNNNNGEVALDFHIGKDKSIKKPNSDLFWSLSQESTDYLKGINYPQLENGDFKWEKYNSPLPFYSANKMTKELSRLTLKITNVRVERLRDIERKDVLLTNGEDETKDNWKQFKYNCVFVDNWNNSAKQGFKWEDNPFVFVYDFELVKGK